METYSEQSAPKSSDMQGHKILFVITKSNWGGAQAYVYAMATQLQKRGAGVAVALGGTGAAGAGAGLLAERLQAAGIRTIFLKSFKRDISIFRELKVMWELYDAIRKEKPDTLHLNSSKAGGIGALAGRLCKVPRIIYTVHGWAHKEQRPLPFRLAIWIASWGTVWLNHCIIVLTQLDYDVAPVFFSRKKLHIVHIGVSPFELLPRNEARTKLNKRGVALASTWILMQAELHRNKGLQVAIEAFPEIVQKYSGIALVIMGEGEERKNLESLIARYEMQQHIFLPGFIPDSKIYLRAGDVVLMTSYKEGLPLSLIEAGYAQVPVVSTRVGGIPELIRDKEDGLLIRPGDTKAVVQALSFLLDNNNLAQQLAENLKERVRKEFSEEKMVEETIALYDTAA